MCIQAMYGNVLECGCFYFRVSFLVYIVLFKFSANFLNNL